MQDKFKFTADAGQTFTSLDSTGAISSNIWDLEEDVTTDQCIKGCLMVKVVSVTFTSGLTEGMIVSLRVDDAASLATARNGSSAGFTEIASKHICKEAIAAGKVFSIPVYEPYVARAKYMGAWPRAASTALVGNVVLSMWFTESPEDYIKNIQKKPS